MNRSITLFGKMLDSSHSGHVVLDVEPHLGDAAEFGLAGQISVLKRQCIETTCTADRDLIRIPEHVAESLRPQPKKRR